MCGANEPRRCLARSGALFFGFGLPADDAAEEQGKELPFKIGDPAAWMTHVAVLRRDGQVWHGF
jgi:hypothetical protein